MRVRFVTHQEDQEFYGSKFVQGENGEVFHHAELIQETKDGYSPGKDAASVRSARDFTPMYGHNIHGHAGVPQNISINTDDDDDTDSTIKASGSRPDDYDAMSVDEWMNNCSLAEDSKHGGSVCSGKSFISAQITRTNKNSMTHAKAKDKVNGKTNRRARASSVAAAGASPKSANSRMSFRPKKNGVCSVKRRCVEMVVESDTSKDTQNKEEGDKIPKADAE